MRKSEIASGVIRVHPRGFGFLQADDPSRFPQDIFVPKHATQNAVDGDRVEVEVNPRVPAKGPEGRVVGILERARKHVAGTILKTRTKRGIFAYVPLLGEEHEVYVEPSEDFQLSRGDRVVMEVIEWGDSRNPTYCRVLHMIGNIDDPSADIPAAIEEYQIRSDFSSDLQAEAEALELELKYDDREDFRDWETVTIDPETAKDFDDAISLIQDSKGHFHLGVHIADVSHYVRPGTALDEEAKLRANSTYFPGQCVPMLPPVLADNLCSLKPHVDRLTVSVLMEFDQTGELLKHRMCRSVIKSDERLSYEQALEILEGRKGSTHKDLIKRMHALCLCLKQKRYERGSLEFAIPEMIVRVDENGKPLRTEKIEYDVTHQMIEEFMLKANEVVATHLSGLGKELTYRVHDTPKEEDLKDFAMLVRAFGFNLPDNPTPQQFQDLFDEVHETPYAEYLVTNYIRRMKLAIYSPENIGHFGLGLSHYCHFTSPIRRYVDLVVHRILFGEPVSEGELKKISDHCSDQERLSAKAENRVILLKKLRLLERFYQNDPKKQYEAVVTKVAEYGVFFEVIDFMLEGFMHVSDLQDGYYDFDSEGKCLYCAETDKSYMAGEKVRVMVKRIDLIMSETEWHLVGEERKARQGRNRGRGRQRRRR